MTNFVAPKPVSTGPPTTQATPAKPQMPSPIPYHQTHGHSGKAARSVSMYNIILHLDPISYRTAVHFSSTNTDFSFNIQGDAQSKPDFNWVGEGQYGGQWFDIFKDTKAQLFTQNRGGPWNVGYSKLYYCLPQPGS